MEMADSTPFRRRIAAGFLLSAALLLAGCGYRFAGGGDSIDPALRTVFVETFVNRTSEANIENILRSAFISQFTQGSRFKLSRSREEADAIFRGTVLSLQASTLAYKANDLAAEERMTVTLEISLEERESGRVIWSDGAFTATGDYAVPTLGAKEAGRKNALAKLGSDTAERAYRLMMSGF
jgi:outer membrane lipopolysaccharide assembly protein LptE/RlpB